MHKAQGATIDDHVCIWNWETMDRQLRYTAMSRTTKYEYVHFGKHDGAREQEFMQTRKVLRDNIRRHLHDDKHKYKFVYPEWQKITVEYVVAMLERCMGRCHWCGKDVKTHDFEENDPDQVSIDRLLDVAGHIKHGWEVRVREVRVRGTIRVLYVTLPHPLVPLS